MNTPISTASAARAAARITWPPVLLLLLAGCTVGPDYARPPLDIPGSYRGAASETNALATPGSIGDLGWGAIFSDPRLEAYVAEALTNNWNIRIAVARVLQAEAEAGVTRSQFFPTVEAGGNWTDARASEEGPSPVPPGVDPEQDYTRLYGGVASYELDLWGRIRRANEAALARLLASEEARLTVRQTLAAEVATAYLTLLELDQELAIATNAYAGRVHSLDLTRHREEGGVASKQDVYQARILVATAEASMAATLRRIERQENALGILLGRNPGTIARGEGFLREDFRVAVPPGLTSDLVRRRPDIRAAEQQLVAANADIGQARAAFFPTVTLTGLFGYESVEFSDLVSAPARIWQFGPSVSVPLFTGGALRGNLAFARAAFDEALARYRQTVQGSFRDVSDSLIDYRRTREFARHQEARTQAHRSACAMAGVRYEGGVTSYLEVLYNEQELFTAELELAQAHLNELLSVVSLYRALGGGWQADERNGAGLADQAGPAPGTGDNTEGAPPP